jgi:hypothetical protein
MGSPSSARRINAVSRLPEFAPITIGRLIETQGISDLT